MKINSINLNESKYKNNPLKSHTQSFKSQEPKVTECIIIVNDLKEYIPYNTTPEGLKNILKDKKKLNGRSFFGYKESLKKHLENSENKNQTIKNINILLNARNKSLSARQISYVLSSFETPQETSLKQRFNYKGGDLTDEMIDAAIIDLINYDTYVAMSVRSSNDFENHFVTQQLAQRRFINEEIPKLHPQDQHQ